MTSLDTSEARSMRVGNALLDLALARGSGSLFVVGTGKNVGKTVVMRAVYEAACARGLRCGLTSIGRDGEAVDAGDVLPKPRLFLTAGTVVATARGVLPHSPAGEMLDLSALETAAGALVYVRVARPAFYELVGPPTASGIREAVDVLRAHCDIVIVDGAIDRVAALAGGNDAIVVATGASSAATMSQAVDEAGALIRRLSVRAHDAQAPSVTIDGALTGSRVTELVARGETRQVVVRDPTQIALTGKTLAYALDRLDVRCQRPLHVVAATVASIGRERHFEPRSFLEAVAAAATVPAFDVYAGAAA